MLNGAATRLEQGTPRVPPAPRTPDGMNRALLNGAATRLEQGTPRVPPASRAPLQ